MKIRSFLILAAAIVAVAFGFKVSAQFGSIVAIVCGWVAFNSIATLLSPQSARLCATTLIYNELLMEVMDAFTKKLPMLPSMGTDFRTGRAGLKLDGVYTAHIAGLPTVQSYDGTTGYKANATSGRTMLTDVSVTVSNHKHVPIVLEYLNSIKDDKQTYSKVLSNAGYVLAKNLIDNVLAGVTAANFSEATAPISINDADADMLQAVCGSMNKVGAADGRTLLVNTDVANVLGADQRMASSFFQNQIQGGEAYRRWTNCYGWKEIIEYPDFPTNGEGLIAFGFDSRAISLMAGPPTTRDPDLAAQMGIVETMTVTPMTHPETGLTMASVSWQDLGTGDLYWTPTILWGKTLGKNGGAAGSTCDYAGMRIVGA